MHPEPIDIVWNIDSITVEAVDGERPVATLAAWSATATHPSGTSAYQDGVAQLGRIPVPDHQDVPPSDVVFEKVRESIGGDRAIRELEASLRDRATPPPPEPVVTIIVNPYVAGDVQPDATEPGHGMEVAS